jgi:putative ABC transport system substrate-binding protein
MKHSLSGRVRGPQRQRWVHLVLLCAAVALSSFAAHSEAASPRIGFLSPSSAQGSEFGLEGFRQGLREHGYVDGTNVLIEPRFANDRFDRLPQLARELLGLPVEVPVAYVTQASIAAKQATATVPIVIVGVSDPVASGLVASLSRPGANITGTSAPFSESAGKGLQLLREALPGLRRVAVLRNPANTVFQAQMLDGTMAAARSLGIELEVFDARDGASIDSAFEAMARQRLAALNVLPDPLFAAHWTRIATLAARLRLPSVTVSSRYAEAGGFMTYGPSLADAARIAGGYVARILKGAKPGDLPVEQSTKFELVINLRTANQLGISVPQTLRLRADRLIE